MSGSVAPNPPGEIRDLMHAKLSCLLLALALLPGARADFFNFRGNPGKDNPMDSNEGGAATGAATGSAKAGLEQAARNAQSSAWRSLKGGGSSASIGNQLGVRDALKGGAALLDKAGPLVDHAGWASTAAGEVSTGHFTQGLFTMMNGLAKAAATGIASSVGATVGVAGGPAGAVAGGVGAGYAASQVYDATAGKLFDTLKGDLGKKEDAAQMRTLASDKMNLGADPDKTLAETHAKYQEFPRAKKEQEKLEADRRLAEAKAAADAKAAGEARRQAEARAAAEAKKLADAQAAAAARVAAAAPAPAAPSPAPAPKEPERPKLGLTFSWGPLPEGMQVYPGKFAGNQPPPPLPNRGTIELVRGAILYCQRGVPRRGSSAVIELFTFPDPEKFPTLAEYTAKAKAQDPHGDFNFLRHVETTVGGRRGYESFGESRLRTNRFFTLNLDPERKITAIILCELGPGTGSPDDNALMKRVLEAALQTFRFEASAPAGTP